MACRQQRQQGPGFGFMIGPTRPGAAISALIPTLQGLLLKRLFEVLHL